MSDLRSDSHGIGISFRSDEQAVRARSSKFLQDRREWGYMSFMGVAAAKKKTRFWSRCWARVWGLAAYGATLSLRHNGVPDSLAHQPLGRLTQVNGGFRAGDGCQFNFGRGESILQPNVIDTGMWPCGYQTELPGGHVRVQDLHNCSVMMEILPAILELRARFRAHLCRSRPEPEQGRGLSPHVLSV